jgi:hypothetical protein
MGRVITRPGLAILLAVLLTLALAAPANAAPAPGLITCVATPRVHVEESTTTPGQFDWTVNGGGACVAAKGTLTVRIFGEGTSTGLGLCSGLFVQDLDIAMTVLVTRVFSGETYVANNHWVASLTTFPVATPFVVNNADNTQSHGAGSIFSHIFLGCPPGGSNQDSSTVTWIQDFKASGGVPASD